MAAKLYVDEIKSNGMFGVTNKWDTIKYNCELFGKELMDYFTNAMSDTGNSTAFVAAGRYFCIISISIEKKIFNMIFVDFKKNDDMFYKYINEGLRKEETWARENSIIAFNRLKTTYDKNYNEVELVVGNPLLK